jgi:hypothetical protein
MIEIIDILDDPGAVMHLLNEQVLKEAVRMIEVNIFRTFTNKSKKHFVTHTYSSYSSQEDF